MSARPPVPLLLALLLLLSDAGAARAALSTDLPAAQAAAPLLRAAELAGYGGVLYPVRTGGAAIQLEAQIPTRWGRERLEGYFRDWAKQRHLAFHADSLPASVPGGSGDQGLRLLRIGSGAALATVSLLPAGGETVLHLSLPPPRPGPGLEAAYPPILGGFPEIAALPAALALAESWRKEAYYAQGDNLALLLRAAKGGPPGAALLRAARERLVAAGWQDLVPRVPGADVREIAPLQLMLRKPGWNLLLFASDEAVPTVFVTLFNARQAPGLAPVPAP